MNEYDGLPRIQNTRITWNQEFSATQTLRKGTGYILSHGENATRKTKETAFSFKEERFFFVFLSFP